MNGIEGKPTNNDPIVSNGLIIVGLESPLMDNQPLQSLEYLICQRRDTIAYAEFLRVHLPIEKYAYYFSLMTPFERKQLAENSFDKLWDDLHINKHASIYHRDYGHAKLHFDKMIQSGQLHELLEHTEAKFSEAPWGFSKGWPKDGETPLETALREFYEETHINLSRIEILNLDPIVDLYVGSDGKWYQSNYYMAIINEKVKPTFRSLMGLRQFTVSDEVQNFRWINLLEAKNALENHYYQVLEKAENVLRSVNTWSFCRKPYVNLKNRKKKFKYPVRVSPVTDEIKLKNSPGNA